MNTNKRAEIFRRLQSANPNPETELEYSTPFELLVAVVLSAQATDKGVNVATRKLFAKANTPETILALGEAGLKDYIRTIGLYQGKAKHIIQTCRMLIEQHHGQVPPNREELEKLPGVGRKTANVILNVASGQPTMAVDTHIFRVANRTGIAPGKAPLEWRRNCCARVPREFMQHAHHLAHLHGRSICQVCVSPSAFAVRSSRVVRLQGQGIGLMFNPTRDWA